MTDTPKPIMERVASTLDAITSALDAYEPTVNPAVQAQAEAEMIAHFRQHNLYAPEGSDVKALTRFRMDNAKVAAAKLGALDRVLYVVSHDDPVVEDALAHHEEPPDTLALFVAQHESHSRAEYLAALTFEAVAVPTVERELAALSPAAMTAKYERALADPTDLRNGLVIRAVETGMRDGKLGTGGGTPEVASAWQKLSNRVAAVRAARVPPEVRKLQAAVAYAKAVSHDGHKRFALPYGQMEDKP